MVTKKLLIEYAKQNPSKYQHKFGHIDLSKYEDDDVINEPKATTKIDGSPADPARPELAQVPANKPHPALGEIVMDETVPEQPVQVETENAPVETDEVENTPEVEDETIVDGGDVNGGDINDNE